VSHNKFDDGTAIALTYLRGWAFQATYYGDFRARSLTSNIQPDRGREITVQVTRENNKFFREFEIDADRFTLQEAYTPYNYNRIYWSWVEYRKLPWWKHALSFNLWGGLIDREVDDFFDYYAGGLNGMKGYSYFSIGGQKMAVGNVAYRFPIVQNLHFQKAHLFFHHVYGGMFADFGNAWDGSLEFGDFKTDVGLSLRTYMTSFYIFPSALELSAAYGLDEFTVVEDDFEQVYGKEWRFYLTLLFDFINSRNYR
jgi:outer membrane protein assembly factor BamA